MHPTVRMTLAQCARTSLLGLLLGTPALAQTWIRGWGQLSFDTALNEVRPRKVRAGVNATLVLRTDGRIFGRGWAEGLQCSVPALPVGTRYVDLDIGDVCLGMRSDGQIEQWGQG